MATSSRASSTAARENAREEGTVKSLCKLCVQYLACNLHTFSSVDPTSGHWSLFPGVHLPPQIGEDLLAALQKRHEQLGEGVFHVFADRAAAPLRRVRHLDASSLSDTSLRWILQNKLVELDMVWSERLSEQSFLAIQEFGSNLSRLSIRNAGSLLKYDLLAGLEENPTFSVLVTHGNLDAIEPSERELLVAKLAKQGSDSAGEVPVRLACPHLRSFTIQSLCLVRHKTAELLEHLCRPLVTLTHLDLSHCPVLVDSLTWLWELRELCVLILHNVPIAQLDVAFDNIVKLKSLRVLDVSTSQRNSHSFASGEVYLQLLVDHLPQLSRLDLSGTNLAVPADANMDTTSSCGVKGLERCRLQFLGLVGCPGFQDPPGAIPAEMVAGTWGIEPLLCAAQVYADRRGMVTLLLPSLLMSLRTMEYSDEQHRKAVKLILDILQRYIYSFSIAHYSILSLAIPLHKGLHTSQLIGPQLKREIILTVLDLMECHWEKTQFNKEELMRKCCATLSYFDLAKDLLFVYERVVDMMLCFIITDRGWVTMHHPLIQTALYILRFMSSQVDVCFKEIAGHRGCIKKMLAVINGCADPEHEGDSILLRAWSVLWSLTDMSPKNCERFLIDDGLDTFLKCYYYFPSDTSLINKMMGMLRNVVEVPHLRVNLLNDQYIKIFYCMLESEPNVSNSACSILAHLLADTSLLWEPPVPMEELLQRMKDAIMRWDLSTRRNVRYRSFEPMLQLLKCYDPIISMHWAAWEVANMVLKDAEHYCPMLEREVGIQLVLDLLEDPRPSSDIKFLGQTIINHWQSWKAGPS